MRSPVFWRRSSAAAGIYLAAFLGFLGSVVAVRLLGISAFGQLALVLAATGLVQLVTDLTVDEAVVKYGFRYAAREDWGRFRRLFRVGLELKLLGGALGAVVLVVLAPFSADIWTPGLVVPMLVAALLPLAQSPEGIAAAALVVHKRYDVRAAFLTVSMSLRLVALAVGASFGVTETVIALVVAQVASTAAIGVAAARTLRRVPPAAAAPLGDDGPAFRQFVIRSSAGSVLSPLRGLLGTLLLGTVSTAGQVAYFRVGQTPESAAASLTAPARLVLLAEQTADVEGGRIDLAYATLRRYMVRAGVAAAVAAVPLIVLMPVLVRVAYGEAAAPAVPAARIFVAVAAIQVVWGWSKSFPVSIGRPGLRLLAQGAEIVVLVPTLIVLGAAYGATGAAGAFLVAAGAFVGVWTILLVRLRRERRAARDAAALPAGP